MGCLTLAIIRGLVLLNICVASTLGEDCTNQPVSLHGFYCNVSCHFSGQHLSDIPVSRIWENVDCLDLSNNNIARIGMGLYKFVKLKILDLSINDITNIDDTDFRKSKSLKFLDIHSNRIIEIQNGSFDNLSQLQLFHVENNFMQIQNRGDLFEKLEILEELHLDGSAGCDMKFAVELGGLKHLTTLSIYGGIDKMCNDTFESFNGSNLQFLSIKSGKLYDIEPNALTPFANLETLNLNDNVHLGLVNMSHGLYGLRNSRIETLYLQRIVKPQLEIELNGSHFIHLNTTRLKNLYLDRNQISVVKGVIFPNHVDDLETLSLSYNSLQHYDDNIFVFYITNIVPLQFLKVLDLSFQMHFDVQSYFELSMDVIGPWPPSLEELICIECYHQVSTLTTSDAFDTSSLKLIDLSYNKFLNITGPLTFKNVTNTSTPVIIRLVGNQVTYISPDLLRKSIQNGFNVSELDLADNRLGYQLQHESENMFLVYKDLQNLNLSGNGVKYLSNGIFKHQTKLRFLNLSNNALTEINFLNENMTNMQHLDLSNNLFSFTDDNMLDILNWFINNTNNFKVNLYGNPLVCSCDTLNSILWMKNNNHFLRNYQTYECLYNSSTINLSKFLNSDSITTLQKSCASRTYVIVAGSIGGLFLLFAVLSFIIYRHHWDLRFYCLQLVNRRKQYQDLQQMHTYKYDAFISYHVSDIRWVKDVLLPELEDTNQASSSSEQSPTPLRLCLHHQDFLPGTSIQDNIINAIDDSFKTILVLTRNFAQSEWCEFELQMARMKCFDKGRDIIVVIMLESVPASMMSKTLQAVIKRNTYIEWPEDKEAQHAFWRKVKRCIKAPESKPLVCECGQYVKHNCNP